MKRNPKQPVQGTRQPKRKLKLVKEIVRKQLDSTVVGGAWTHHCKPE
jgi:hypothetical protein